MCRHNLFASGAKKDLRSFAEQRFVACVAFAFTDQCEAKIRFLNSLLLCLCELIYRIAEILIRHPLHLSVQRTNSTTRLKALRIGSLAQRAPERAKMSTYARTNRQAMQHYYYYFLNRWFLSL